MTTLYALALLCSNNDVLLVRRAATQPFGAGRYSLVGGKVEENERALAAIKREVLEETGLQIPEEKFSLVHTFHRLGTEGPFIALCFKADITGMQPQNLEPDKHDDMHMFSLNNLPQNILPGHKQVIDRVMQANYYSEHGWK